jgi:hypothetical protein
VKEFLLKILRKVSFLLWGRQFVPLGQMVCRLLSFIEYPWFLE